jgi:Flp pilus assembly protein TadG
MRNLAIRGSAKAWQRLIGFGRACEGATAVETAIVFPAFFLMLFGIIEGGILFHTQSTLQFAVEAAARCAAVNTNVCGTTDAVQDYAVSQLSGLPVSSASFSVTQPAGCAQQVSISHPFSSVVPLLIPWTITLNAQSCHP